MVQASDHMPWSVRLVVGVWLLLFALVVGVPFAESAIEWVWPWADQADHAVIHLQNDSGVEAVLRVTRERGFVLHREGSLMSGPYALIFHPVVPNHQVHCRIDFPATPGRPPVDTAVAVAPGDHVRFLVGNGGKVSLARGRQSWLGYPTFGSPVVAVASK